MTSIVCICAYVSLRYFHHNHKYVRLLKETGEYRQMLMHAGRFVRFRASGEAKFPKMGYSLPRTPLNHRAKFDAASFILAEDIRNRTNKQKTNSKQ